MNKQAMIKRSVLLVFGVLVYLSSISQVDLTDHFEASLEAHQLEFIYPVESRYKVIKRLSNSLVLLDFGIRSRKSNIEIYYLLESESEQKILESSPSVAAFSMAMHLATNDEDGMISNLSFSEKALREDYNADWARLFIFQPKTSFSVRKNCKMLCMYKEGVGMAYVFLLFDKNSMEIDNRLQALRYF